MFLLAVMSMAVFAQQNIGVVLTEGPIQSANPSAFAVVVDEAIGEEQLDIEGEAPTEGMVLGWQSDEMRWVENGVRSAVFYGLGQTEREPAVATGRIRTDSNNMRLLFNDTADETYDGWESGDLSVLVAPSLPDADLLTGTSLPDKHYFELGVGGITLPCSRRRTRRPRTT